MQYGVNITLGTNSKANFNSLRVAQKENQISQTWDKPIRTNDTWEHVVMMWTTQREKDMKRSSFMKARDYGQGYHQKRNRKCANGKIQSLNYNT